MFTGIVEGTGKVISMEKQGTNIVFTLSSPFTNELKIDQSLAHNGVCLTVTSIREDTYTVCAIDETLIKTNLSFWKEGEKVNLERCVALNARMDGHMVQGHVDTLGKITSIQSMEGSWIFTFEHPQHATFITVEKGSICVNGVSLTVVESQKNGFSVAVIPYTYEHTNFNNLKEGDFVNLEFDILGKYITKYLELYRN